MSFRCRHIMQSSAYSCTTQVLSIIFELPFKPKIGTTRYSCPLHQFLSFSARLISKRTDGRTNGWTSKSRIAAYSDCRITRAPNHCRDVLFKLSSIIEGRQFVTFVSAMVSSRTCWYSIEKNERLISLRGGLLQTKPCNWRASQLARWTDAAAATDADDDA